MSLTEHSWSAKCALVQTILTCQCPMNAAIAFRLGTHNSLLSRFRSGAHSDVPVCALRGSLRYTDALPMPHIYKAVIRHMLGL